MVAGSAEEALRLAREMRPHAIVLDVGLPDQSGLAVLDQLKRDVQTRHIPVHVVSASENAQTALSLGAIGYLLKPVKREDLLAALRRLEGRLDEKMRRVLIVEDDPVQRDGGRRSPARRRRRDRQRRHRGGMSRAASSSRPSTAWCSTCRCPAPPATRCSKR